MTLALPLVLLAAFDLPRHVESPGPAHVSVAGGVEGLQPALDVRVGIVRWWDVRVEGVWFDEAPIAGVQLRFALGEKEDAVFAHVWTEGHVRPLFDAGSFSGGDILSGADVGLGVGLVGLWSGLSVRLDGGAAVGVALNEAPGVDDSAIDQQGGVFGVQRLWAGYDLFDRVALAGGVDLAIPIARLDPADDGEELVQTWDVRLGARLAFRI